MSRRTISFGFLLPLRSPTPSRVFFSFAECIIVLDYWFYARFFANTQHGFLFSLRHGTARALPTSLSLARVRVGGHRSDHRSRGGAVSHVQCCDRSLSKDSEVFLNDDPVSVRSQQFIR